MGVRANGLFGQVGAGFVNTRAVRKSKAKSCVRNVDSVGLKSSTFQHGSFRGTALCRFEAHPSAHAKNDRASEVV
eukprot:1388980-Rhodomonas_salina.2